MDIPEDVIARAFEQDAQVGWFGHNWGAAIYDDCPKVDRPTGELCLRCEEPIGPNDDGFVVPAMVEKDAGTQEWVSKRAPLHRACHLRSIFGGVNCQKMLCRCHGGTLPSDPEGMTKREAAEAALELFMTDIRRKGH